MAVVTYIDKNEDCPRTKFHGVPFKDGVPVTLDDEEFATLIDTADGNGWFKVERAKEEPITEDHDALTKARLRGAQAFADGKAFSIPPRWRRLKIGEAWAGGFTDAKRKSDQAKDALVNA